MKQNPLFLKTTKKLYEEVNKRKDDNKSSPHYNNLDIIIEKEFFNDDEWNFLKQNKDNFKFPIQINGEPHKLVNVYQIENNELKTNGLNVIGIKNNFIE